MSDSDTDETFDSIADEFVTRYRNGEHPPLSEYTKRYPELADRINELFPALLMIENLKVPDDEEDTAESVRGSDGLELARLGDYRIIREVGRGGMGVVYEAEQVSLGRRVALKVLSTDLIKKSVHRARFQREARTAAMLHHTNIVPIFGVGVEEDMDYIVMQFIAGRALDEVMEEVKELQDATPADSDSSFTHEHPDDVCAAQIAHSMLTGGFSRGSELQPDPDDLAMSPIHAAVTEVAPVVRSAPRDSGTTPTAMLSESDAVHTGDKTSLVPAQSESLTPDVELEPAYYRTVADVGFQAADALHYAHGKGILHRDIKPANLMLDQRGSTWVTDFGLAKLEDDQTLTQTGDVMGTLRYMAPETFKGRGDARSDVYSLGLTLYEMLVLRPAFDQTDRAMLIDQVMRGSPTSLESLKPDIPVDLRTIVQKAIERDPGHRYQTAGELAEDLHRYLNDEPIRARPISTIERLGRWARRNKAMAACVAVICVLLLVINIAGPIFSWQLIRLNDDLHESKGDLEVTVSQLRSTQQKLTHEAAVAQNARLAEEKLRYLAEMYRAAEAAQEVGGSTTAMQIVDFWRAGGSGEDLRGWEWHYLNSLNNRADLSIQATVGRLLAVDFSPDGTRLAAIGPDRSSVRIYDAQTGWKIASWPCPSGHDLQWSYDGSIIAVGTHPGSVVVLDPENGRELNRLQDHRALVAKVAWSRQGRLASVDRRGVVIIWDLDRSAALRTISGLRRGRLCWSLDGKSLLCSAEDGAKLIDAETGQVQLHVQAGVVHSVDWSPDGSQLVTGNKDGDVQVWETSTGSHVRSIRAHEGPVSDVRFSPDGGMLATSGEADNTVKVWAAKDGSSLAVMKGHTERTMCLDWSPDGKRLASSGWFGVAKIWDLERVLSSGPVLHCGAPVHRVAWTHDGLGLLCATESEALKVDPQTRKVLLRIPTQGGFAEPSPNGRSFATAQGQTITIRDLETGREVQSLSGGGGSLNDLKWSPKGEYLAATFPPNQILIWNVETGQPPGPPMKRQSSALAWSPDGALLFDVGFNRYALTNVRTGKVLYDKPDFSTGWLTSAVWDPISNRIAAGTQDKQVRLIWPEEGDVIRELTGHIKWVQSVSWHPDGSRILSCGDDALIRLWDSESGRSILRLRGHDGPVKSVSWSPDGLQFASGGVDGTVRFWDATVSYELDQSKKILTRKGPKLEKEAEIRDLTARVAALRKAGRIRESTQARDRLVDLLERRLSENRDSQTAGALAMVVADDRPADWTTLKFQSGGVESEFTILDDNSLLVDSQKKVDESEYVLSAELPEQGVAALKLEAIPDPSLPERGSGVHYTGNFRLSEFVVQAGSGDGPWTRVPVQRAYSDYGHSGQDARNIIDGDKNSVWSVFQQERTPHYAIVMLDEPIRAESGTSIRILLRFFDSKTRLGRFRVLATTDPLPELAVRLKQDLVTGELDGFSALGFAYAAKRDVEKSVAAFTTALSRAKLLTWKLKAVQAAAQFPEVLERLATELPNEPALLVHQFQKRTLGWQTLHVVEAQSDGGAVLTVQKDGSILASGDNASADVYSITTTTDLPVIGTFRLEVLPDQRLPNNGPGRHPTGNFQLKAFRVFTQESEGDELTPLRFRHAETTYQYEATNVDVRAVIDDNDDRMWHVFGKFGKPNLAIFTLNEPIQPHPEQSIVVTLEHQPFDPPINLGRFRLSAIAKFGLVNESLLRAAMQANALSARSALASYQLLAGEPSRTIETLSPTDEDVDVCVTALIRATAFLELDDAENAKTCADELIDSLSKHTLHQTLRPWARRILTRLAGLNVKEANQLLAK